MRITKAAFRIDLFADGETGNDGIGSKLHAGAGLDVKF